MHRREVLAAAGIGTTVATAGCLGQAFGSEGSQTTGAPPDGDEGNEIEVTGSGRVDTEPDRASLRVGVTASGDSAEAVRSELAADAATLRSALEDLGIPDENIESGRYSIREARQRSGFEGGHTYQVTLDDPDEVGTVIDASVDAGADDVGRVTFGLQEETREALREEALERALDDADAEALAIAANREVEITGTRSVSTSDVGVTPYRTTVLEADVQDTGTEIDEGPVTVSATVTVVYNFA